MALHDWSRVPAGIFHDFHVEWIASIKHALNHGILPEGYYSLTEQYAGPFGPDVLTLQTVGEGSSDNVGKRRNGPLPSLAKPRRKPVAHTEMAYYRSKQKIVTVRHVSDDEVIAVVELVSPGNKKQRSHFAEFIDKAAWFLDQRIHLSIIDVFAPTRRDPAGIHGAIWEAIADQAYRLPFPKKNRTAVSYECGVFVQAYVEHFSIGDRLPNMALFLEADGCVEIPLESTYNAALAEVPSKWRSIISKGS